MSDRLEVGDKGHGSARGYIDAHATPVGFLERLYGRGGHGVGGEAHQRAVDVEKECFDIHYRRLIVVIHSSEPSQFVVGLADIVHIDVEGAVDRTRRVVEGVREEPVVGLLQIE